MKDKVYDLMKNNKGMCCVHKYIHILHSLIETFNIEGDMVEMGCFYGGTSMVISYMNENKQLYVYDSFEGLPEKHINDGNDMFFDKGILKLNEIDLINNFKNNNIKLPVNKKTWFKDLTDNDIPKKISFAFLDGDFYESIKDSLNLIYNNVSSGGIILIDDYNHQSLPGVQIAVEEFLKNKNDCIHKECEYPSLVKMYKIQKL